MFPEHSQEGYIAAARMGAGEYRINGQSGAGAN